MLQILEDPSQQSLPARAIQELIAQCVPVRHIWHARAAEGQQSAESSSFCLDPAINRPLLQRLVALQVCLCCLCVFVRECVCLCERERVCAFVVPTAPLWFPLLSK